MSEQSPCVWCHPLTGRALGRAVTAGCVNEHLSALYLCDMHEQAARGYELFCVSCLDAGHQVPVRVLTAACDLTNP